jgi:hypothetical protein
MNADTDHDTEPGRRWLLVAAVALMASALTLVMLGESEWPMFALGLGGLMVGAALGVSDRHLAVLTFALIVLAWPIAVFTSPVPRATSTLTHLVVAALLAWALAGPIRSRWRQANARPWSPRWFLVPLFVLMIGAAWELGELIADALFETDLALRPFDTVADLAADFAGAVVGLALHDRALPGSSGRGTLTFRRRRAERRE